MITIKILYLYFVAILLLALILNITSLSVYGPKSITPDNNLILISYEENYSIQYWICKGLPYSKAVDYIKWETYINIIGEDKFKAIDRHFRQGEITACQVVYIYFTTLIDKLSSAKDYYVLEIDKMKKILEDLMITKTSQDIISPLEGVKLFEKFKILSEFMNIESFNLINRFFYPEGRITSYSEIQIFYNDMIEKFSKDIFEDIAELEVILNKVLEMSRNLEHEIWTLNQVIQIIKKKLSIDFPTSRMNSYRLEGKHINVYMHLQVLFPHNFKMVFDIYGSIQEIRLFHPFVSDLVDDCTAYSCDFENFMDGIFAFIESRYISSKNNDIAEKIIKLREMKEGNFVVYSRNDVQLTLSDLCSKILKLFPLELVNEEAFTWLKANFYYRFEKYLQEKKQDIITVHPSKLQNIINAALAQYNVLSIDELFKVPYVLVRNRRSIGVKSNPALGIEILLSIDPCVSEVVQDSLIIKRQIASSDFDYGNFLKNIKECWEIKYTSDNEPDIMNQIEKLNTIDFNSELLRDYWRFKFEFICADIVEKMSLLITKVYNA